MIAVAVCGVPYHPLDQKAVRCSVEDNINGRRLLISTHCRQRKLHQQPVALLPLSMRVARWRSCHSRADNHVLVFILSPAWRFCVESKGSGNERVWQAAGLLGSRLSTAGNVWRRRGTAHSPFSSLLALSSMGASAVASRGTIPGFLAIMVLTQRRESRVMSRAAATALVSSSFMAVGAGWPALAARSAALEADACSRSHTTAASSAAFSCRLCSRLPAGNRADGGGSGGSGGSAAAAAAATRGRGRCRADANLEAALGNRERLERARAASIALKGE